MKTIILAISLFFVATTETRSQLLFEENFDYTVGDSVRGRGWNITGTSTVNTISVVAPGLSYTGYPSSAIGNACSLTNNGQDVHDTLSAGVTANTVYASFLVRVTAALTGDYFFHLTTTTAPTTSFFARTFVRAANNGNLAFGISKFSVSATIPVSYSDSIYSLNTTYLFVVKYQFNAGTTTDDAVSLFVFADPTLPLTEPVTPTVGPITSTQTDATELGLVALRQGTSTSAPTLVIDGIRVGTLWLHAPLPIQLASFTARPTPDLRCVTVKWRTISETNNFGFYVQRSRDNANFIRVSNFIPGYGTTIEPHEYEFRDCTVYRSTWYYRLEQIDLDGSTNYTSSIGVEVESPTSVTNSTPAGFELQQNYPNPFNPSTTIRFSVESTGKTTLRVFNLIGQEVATLFNNVAEAGKYYAVKFESSSFPSGVYIYKLESGNKSSLKKLTLMK